MVGCGGRLRNIRFKDLSARILSIENISRVLIKWELEPTSQKLDNLVFVVERAESPSEWSTVSGRLSSSRIPEYVDYTTILFDKHKDYLYRVKAIELSTEGEVLQIFESPEFSLSGELDHVGLYIVEEHLYAFRHIYGVPTLIYKKRFDGDRCPHCWDSVLKKITKSNCKACYGTGRLDGYYPPIEAWMDIGNRVKQAGVGQNGVQQPESVNANFTNYPNIRIGDIIFEPQHHFFWKVNAVTSPEKNLVGMLQTLQMSSINRSDIEYKLHIPQNDVERLLSELEERKGLSEF